MELLANGQVKMTDDDLEAMKARGFSVNMHTDYYTNGISVLGIGGAHDYEVGFYNWLDNLDCYVGGEAVKITSEAHLAAVLNLMDAMVAVNQYNKRV